MPAGTHKTFAQNNQECSLQTTPSVLTTELTDASFLIDTPGLTSGKSYLVFIDGESIYHRQSPGSMWSDSMIWPFEVGDKHQIKISLTDPDYLVPRKILDYQDKLKAGQHIIEIKDDSLNPNNPVSKCSLKFDVSFAGNYSCSIELLPKNSAKTVEEKRTLWANITGFNKQTGKRLVTLNLNDINGPSIYSDCIKTPTSSPLNFGTLDTGNYILTTYNSCTNFFQRWFEQIDKESPVCSNFLSVTNEGIKIITSTTSPTNATTRAPFPPCIEKIKDGKIESITCNTAIGKIDVSSPATIVSNILSIILSLAGIGAMGLFIYAGYLFMTSEGDKQKIQGARETITSAISGLLFIIFSIVILEIIGVNILHLPGFGA